jgi:hypothetical protein
MLALYEKYMSSANIDMINYSQLIGYPQADPQINAAAAYNGGL